MKRITRLASWHANSRGVFKYFDTAGTPVFGPVEHLECPCNATGGCSVCRPMIAPPNWTWDVKYNYTLKERSYG